MHHMLIRSTKLIRLLQHHLIYASTHKCQPHQTVNVTTTNETLMIKKLLTGKSAEAIATENWSSSSSQVIATNSQSLATKTNV